MAVAALGALALGGCAGVNMPFNMDKMTPEQIAAFAKIKEANMGCLVVNSVYGRAVGTFLNLDKGVLPPGTSVSIDEQCKTTITSQPPAVAK